MGGSGRNAPKDVREACSSIEHKGVEYDNANEQHQPEPSRLPARDDERLGPDQTCGPEDRHAADGKAALCSSGWDARYRTDLRSWSTTAEGGNGKHGSQNLWDGYGRACRLRACTWRLGKPHASAWSVFLTDAPCKGRPCRAEPDGSDWLAPQACPQVVARAHALGGIGEGIRRWRCCATRSLPA